jgi:molecular chaperone GrpE
VSKVSAEKVEKQRFCLHIFTLKRFHPSQEKLGFSFLESLMQPNDLKQNEQTEAEKAEQTPAEPQEAAAEAPELPDLDPAEELAKAQAKAAENYDLYVRAVAEKENARRRAWEDAEKARKFAIEKFAGALLPVVDSMEKALEATEGTSGPIREGLEVTHRQLVSALEANGMKSENPLGEKFDPNKMQAIAMIPSAEVASGHVAQVFQRGWMLSDRVLRPAMVAVAQ